MSAPLQRTRSLRKKATTTQGQPRSQPTTVSGDMATSRPAAAGIGPGERGDSPSRLPVKPGGVARAASTAVRKSMAGGGGGGGGLTGSAVGGRSASTTAAAAHGAAAAAGSGGGREHVGREAVKRESMRHEPSRHEAIKREASKRESVRYEPSIKRETSKRDSTRREPSVRQPHPPPSSSSSSSSRLHAAAARPRPTSAGGNISRGPTPTQPRRAPTHTRARSTATALQQHPHDAADGPLLAPPRPLSDRPRVASAAPATATTTTTTTTTTTMNRTSSIARGSTASTGIRASTGGRMAGPRPSTPPAAPKPLQQAPQPRLRPAFTTLQQHYSPAKNMAPKPLTSTFLAPPSPSKLPANVAASADASRLQAELLQLHLLHRDAAPTQSQWQASARDQLSRRFAALCAADRAHVQDQRAVQEHDAILALRRWGDIPGSRGLDDKVQLLGEVMSGIWALSEPDGRYARAVRRFERWAAGVARVEAAREDSSAALLLSQQHALFIDELDAPWRDECVHMARRLRNWAARLEEIDDLPRRDCGGGDDGHDEDDENDDGDAKGGGGGGGGGSSLERMLAGAGSLADNMLAELRAMEEMEREAVVREDEWVAQMNRDDGSGDGGDDEGAVTGGGGAWRIDGQVV